MTLPRELGELSIEEVPLGETVGRSWILLFGLLPIEYDDLRLAELEPGRRFQEDSSMLTMRVWRHERVIRPTGEGACRVTDRLAFELRPVLARIPGARRLARAIVSRVFAHRHRRLTRYFAGRAATR